MGKTVQKPLKKQEKTREVRCPFCLHIQKTGSKLKKITCSSCQNKIYVVENLVDPLKDK